MLADLLEALSPKGISVSLFLAVFFASLLAIPFSTSHAQVRCFAWDAYKKEGADLWQDGSRLEQALRQRGKDAATKAKSCEEARAFEARVEAYIAKESKVQGDCYLRENITVLNTGGTVDAKPYSARMMSSYCGEVRSKEERGISESTGGSDWSYRGRIFIPIGLIIALLLIGWRVLRLR